MSFPFNVATVLTVYGIETYSLDPHKIDLLFQSQQYLPFTVLKPSSQDNIIAQRGLSIVATVLTVYGIETSECLQL